MDPIELRDSAELDSFLSEFGSRNRIKRNSTCSARSRSRKNSLNDKNNEEASGMIPFPITATSNLNLYQDQQNQNQNQSQQQQHKTNNNNNNNNNNSIWRSQEFHKIQIISPSDTEKGRDLGTNQISSSCSKGAGGESETDHLKSCKMYNNCDRDDGDEDDCTADMVNVEFGGGDDEVEEDEEDTPHKFTGLGLALLSCLAFSLSSLIVKYMKDYHPFSKCVWRFQGLVVPAIPMMLYSNKFKKEPIFETVWPVCENENWKNVLYLTLRSTAGFGTIILQFYSLQYITLADQMVLGASQPVFVSIMAYFMLGEKCGIVPFAICCLTILGVCVVAKPPILTGAESFDEDVLIGSSLAMASMGLSVMSIIFMRRMKNVHFTLITFSFGIYSTVVSLIVALILNVFQLPQGTEHIIYAIGLACLVFVSQTCTTIALKYEQAGPVSLTRTSNIIFGFIWQYIFLGVIPDYLSVIGASIIVVGVVLTALRKWISTLPENNATRNKLACILK